MRRVWVWIAFGVAVSAVSCHRAPPKPQNAQTHLSMSELTAPSVATGEQIAWREGDVDDAFAEAKESGKPILLYWGAKWCPPCNQLKSTLFRDPAFITQTRNFVPVHLDGDTAGAQRWGERFGISGYPTVIVLRADGSEITRLSGATPNLSEVLHVAAGRTTSIVSLLDKATKNTSALSEEDLQLLAAFDWQNDTKHFSNRSDTSKLLTRLANSTPKGAIQRRFALLAITFSAQKNSKGKLVLNAEQQARIMQVLPAILAQPDEVVANRQDLSYSVPSLVAVLPNAKDRSALSVSLIKALDGIYANRSLPIPDRLGVVNADLVLDKAGGKPVSPAVLAKVRDRAAWVDQAAKEAMVRQSSISNAAELLHEAGDDAGARKMLEAELKRSAAPYYYMLDLAGIAEDDKDAAAAIAWARKAYETSEGQATRVQWAIEYSKTVLRQAPSDKLAVKASAEAVIDELSKNSGSYYQRTRVKVETWGKLLKEWSISHHGNAILRRINKKMTAVCDRQGEASATCRKWTQSI